MNPMLSELETEHVLRLIGERDGDILEIGCNVGITTAAIARAFPYRTVFAVDCVKFPSPISQFQSNETPTWENVCIHARNLRNVVYMNLDTRRVISYCPWSVGVAFIDGDHTNIFNDVQATRTCGRLIFHDYNKEEQWINVKRQLDSLFGNKVIPIPSTYLAYINRYE